MADTNPTNNEITAQAPEPSIPQRQSSYLQYEDGSQRTRVKKRIVLCCDGTWQDGLSKANAWMFTNVLRMARAINHQDERFDPPIPQVVFYQSGIGTEDNLYSEYIEGATGASLAAKVQEAYGFIAHNYQPGDDIYVFGFSRGAYTARMVAMFVGAIGVLNRTDMDHFADIFVDFQKRGKSKDKDEIAKLDASLAPWESKNAPGKQRADSDDDSFSVKVVGVFDTVGNLGLPDELKLHSQNVKTVFGFPDKRLGEHVENAFQALALNETRKDFNCTLFEQTPGGKAKNQVLKQCWFTGEHSDIGGGWHDHDLADLTFAWMCSNVEQLLSLDFKYIGGLPDPVAPWGQQLPHDPREGIYSFSDSIVRQFPTVPNPVTNETIHPSVLKQTKILPALQQAIDEHPDLIHPLHPFEQQLKEDWPYVPGKNPPQDIKQEHIKTASTTSHSSFLDKTIAKGTVLYEKVSGKEVPRSDNGAPMDLEYLGKLVEQSHLGPYMKEVVNGLKR